MHQTSVKKVVFLGLIFALSLCSCRGKGPENTTGYYHPKALGHIDYVFAYIGYKTDGEWYDIDSDYPYTLAIANTVESEKGYYDEIEDAVKVFVYCTVDPYLESALRTGEYLASIYYDEDEKYKHLEEEGGWLLYEFEPEDFFSDRFSYTIEKNIMNYNFEEETYLSKEIINALIERQKNKIVSRLGIIVTCLYCEESRNGDTQNVAYSEWQRVSYRIEDNMFRFSTEY